MATCESAGLKVPSLVHVSANKLQGIVLHHPIAGNVLGLSMAEGTQKNKKKTKTIKDTETKEKVEKYNSGLKSSFTVFCALFVCLFVCLSFVLLLSVHLWLLAVWTSYAIKVSAQKLNFIQ